MFWKDELKMIRRSLRERKVTWSEAYKLYYVSAYWDVLKQLVLKRDKYACVVCGSKYELHVDHLSYPKVVGDEDVNQLQTLCAKCHEKKSKQFDIAAGKKYVARVKSDIDDQLYALTRRKR
jgi:5-methylcytosine-specific restriction endonuclease McrA